MEATKTTQPQMATAEMVPAETVPVEMPLPGGAPQENRNPKEKSLQNKICDLAGPNPAHSLDELNKDIQLHPQSPEAYLHRGQAYLYDGDTDNALKDFNQAVALNPKFAQAHIGISRTYQCLTKYQLAFGELQRAEALAGNSDLATSALWENAFLHREVNQMDIALEQYNAVLKKGLVGRSRQAFAQFQRGELYMRIGKFDKARPDIDAAIKVDPDVVIFRLARSHLFESLNKPDQALAEINQAIAIEQRKDRADSQGDLGWHLGQLYEARATLYRRLGRKDLAARDWKAQRGYQRNMVDMMPFRTDP